PHLRGQCESPARRRHLRTAPGPARGRRRHAVRGRRSFGPLQREHPRQRRVHRSVDGRARGKSHGAAHHAGRGEARLGPAGDGGGVKMARAYAKRLGADLALTDKRRPKPDSVEIMNIIGDVTGKTCILFDDLVTTASTLCLAAEAIRKQGALDIYAGVTHGVFSVSAFDRIAKSPIKEIVTTDTIDHTRSPVPA